MLLPAPVQVLPAFDQEVFDLVVEPNHYLRRVSSVIDFERFRLRLSEPYNAHLGRPAIDPVRMFKILFLRFQYKLSDRQVMERTKTDMAFRWFLGITLHADVPNHTDGTYFRKRQGAERFTQVFQDLVTQAREAGLVKDRLRLKDATHLLADVADVQPLQLVAQIRERLLQAATPFFAVWVQEQRATVELMQQTTAEFSDEERLAARFEHLRELAAQLQECTAGLPAATAQDRRRLRLQHAQELVAKLLTDHSATQATDRLVNAVDPEARIGMHGGFFLGYMLDLAIDAESELITSVNVLPGNQGEAADAITLIQQEETAQGNDVAALSMDGAGYKGPLLRELTNPEGLNLDVTVPLPKPAERTTFGTERFTQVNIDDEHSAVICPQGQSTQQRSRTRQGTGYRYQFKTSQCVACPLRAQCLENSDSKRGRVVVKNDYEAEYARMEAKSKTPEFEATRRSHPKIERKLNEMVRHHRARRTAYRGLAKVRSQGVLTALVVNAKRMVKLLLPSVPTRVATPPLRAKLVAT
jgi:transposase